MKNWKTHYCPKVKLWKLKINKILPKGVECIFVRQTNQLGLGRKMLCAEKAVGKEPFAVILADEFLTDYDPGATSDLVSRFNLSGKTSFLFCQ